MLKKSLIAIAVLAIALPAMAGDLKVHDPWPTSYVKQKICSLDVIMDIGYYIHVKDQKPIEISQVTSADNPYETYSGCKTTDVISNFAAKLSTDFSNKSAAGGDWSGTFNGSNNKVIPAGTTSVEICVTGKKVKLENLIENVEDEVVGLAGKKNYKVCQLNIMVIPAE